jgi:hypothetical protein
MEKYLKEVLRSITSNRKNIMCCGNRDQLEIILNYFLMYSEKEIVFFINDYDQIFRKNLFSELKRKKHLNKKIFTFNNCVDNRFVDFENVEYYPLEFEGNEINSFIIADRKHFWIEKNSSMKNNNEIFSSSVYFNDLEKSYELIEFCNKVIKNCLEQE